MPSNKRLLRFLALPGLAILLLWPAIVNRGPFFFPDTRTYMRIADAAVNRLTHKTTSWTAVQSDSTKETSTQLLASPQDSSTNRLSLILPSPTSLSRTRSLGTIKQTGFMYGRSLYYGLLLYLGAISGNFWLTIFLQACSVLLAVYLLIKSLNYPIWPGLAVITITLSVFSNVAFFYVLSYAGSFCWHCRALVRTSHLSQAHARRTGVRSFLYVACGWNAVS